MAEQDPEQLSTDSDSQMLATDDATLKEEVYIYLTALLIEAQKQRDLEADMMSTYKEAAFEHTVDPSGWTILQGGRWGWNQHSWIPWVSRRIMRHCSYHCFNRCQREAWNVLHEMLFLGTLMLIWE